MLRRVVDRADQDWGWLKANCHYYGISGHWKVISPTGIVCFACGWPGHRIRGCQCRSETGGKVEALKEVKSAVDFLGTLEHADVDDGQKEVVVRVQLSKLMIA